MTRDLGEAIRALAELLRAQGDERWAAELTRDADLVANDDFYGVERFLSHFGGMGSLNDVVSRLPDGADALTRAYALAHEARRSFRSGGG